jgi:hypothetical protein
LSGRFISIVALNRAKFAQAFTQMPGSLALNQLRISLQSVAKQSQNSRGFSSIDSGRMLDVRRCAPYIQF